VVQPANEGEASFAGFGGKGSVRAFLHVPAGAPWRAGESYVSEQNGAASKLSLYPGRYAVHARGANGVALTTIDTAALPPGPLQIELRRGAPLRIDNRAGDGMVSYAITTAAGQPVSRGVLGRQPGFVFDLPPGDYRVRVATGVGVPQERSFTLPPAGATLSIP
jgi:hypothetical protein